MMTYMVEIGRLMRDTNYNFADIKHKLETYLQHDWSMRSEHYKKSSFYFTTV